MVIERELEPFMQWLLPGGSSYLGALLGFFVILGVLGVVSLFVGFLIGMVRYGPMKAGDKTYRIVSRAFSELFHFSPRRVWALARLSIQEALRRHVLVAIILFMMLLLFAGWFIRTDVQEPGRLFITFVMWATMLLILGIALLVSAFSLPADIKSKTIYTVVTKPVQSGEIVLGRILGFTIIGSTLLLLMGISSYVFVVRALHHTHVVDTASLENITRADRTIAGKKGSTTKDAFHTHVLNQDEDNLWELSSSHGHTHMLKDSADSSSSVTIEEPLGFMRARVPQYGSLAFLDRRGSPKSVGINVGNEWSYRSFIDGRTAAAAIWTFSDVRLADYNEGLDLELLVRVFRSHKGNIDRGIRGELFLQNPSTKKRTKSVIFTALDDTIDRHYFAKEQVDTHGGALDLFKDLVNDEGKIQVIVKCLEPGQYFGFAKADCYLHLADASPFWNFWKAFFSIWVQMVLVIAIGVTCSTLVSGPIAALFTVGIILLGFNQAAFLDIAQGTNYGGGPVESLVRMITQNNMITPLEAGAGTTVVKTLDGGIKGVMLVVAQVLPNFPRFNTTNYVAEGFNIPANQVFQDLLICIAYVIGLSILGYFFLRTREVAK